MYIDLNADLGESFGSWSMGDDEAMMDVISSASIACGGHAGDNATMFSAVSAAKSAGVTIGAHPGFEDRQGFGRRRLPLTMAEVAQLIAAQLGALTGVAALAGATVTYVKPHGALGNWASEDGDVARAVASAVDAVMGSDATILAIAGTTLEKAANAIDMKVYSEVFADRGYTPAGNLVPRNQPGAMIHDTEEASQRLIQFFETGMMPTVGGEPVALTAQSVCIHGDSPTALTMAQEVKRNLEQADFTIRSFMQVEKA